MAKKTPEINTSTALLRNVVSLLDTPRSSFGEIVTERLKIQSGWSFPYNLDPVFVDPVVLNGGTVVHETSFAKLQTSTDPDGYAEIHTKRALVYTPGIGAVAKFTAIFDNPVADSLQLIGIGNGTDGWFFGYNGLKFGIMRMSNSIEHWVYQDEWNKKLFPNLNPQKGNVYQVDFQWLGFGAQYFSIEDSEGDVTLAHQINYTNKNIDVSVQNPSLPITAKIKNTGNTTNLTLKTPSSVAGSYGDIDSSAFEFPVGYDQIDKVIGAGVETYLFSIKNPDIYLTKKNRLYIVPTLLSVSSDGTKSVVIRVYFNPTLTNPVWVDVIPGITPAQSDIAATAISGGLKVLTLVLGKVDSKLLDVTSLRGLVSSDGIVSITAESTNASEITTGLTFKSRV